MSAEEKKFLSGCGCYVRFEQKVIHSLDELRKSRPCPISERVCTFSLGLFNSPLFGASVLIGLFKKHCHTNGFSDFRVADFLVFTLQAVTEMPKSKPTS